MKLFSPLFILLVLFSSCSKDDSPDIIIGKWRAIARYEANQPVELSVCTPYFYTEFKANNSVSGGRIPSSDFPEECSLIQFDLGIVWGNLGNSTYRIGYVNEQGYTYLFYKEGENLVQEALDGSFKTIYEPY
jgi:hypothetical protein